MRTIFPLAAAFAVSLTSAATAATYTLDFDLDPGETLVENPTLDSTSTQSPTSPRTITDGGVSWIVTAGGGGVALFDTTCPYGVGAFGCNDDEDLRPLSGDGDVEGNILVQQDDGSSKPIPNDDASTEFLILELASDIRLRWTGVSAVDDGIYDFFTRKGLVDSAVLGSIEIGADSGTGKVAFTSEVLSLGDKVVIDFTRSPGGDDSGGVDSLTFGVVPVPASLPLLLGGFGLLAAAKRSRKARS